MSQPTIHNRRFSFLFLSLFVLLAHVRVASQETAGHEWRIPYRVGALWGLADINKKIIAPARYDSIEMGFHQPQSLIRVSVGGQRATPVRGVDAGTAEGSRWGMINGDGAEIFPARYEQIVRLENGLIWFELGGKKGLMNLAGKEIVPLHERRVDFIFEGNLIWVRDDREQKGELYRLDGGRIDVPLNKGEKFSYDDGLVTFSIPYGSVSGYGIVDAIQTKVIRLKYASASSFRNGLALVSVRDSRGRNERCGFIDTTGREVVAPVYEECEPNGFGGDSQPVARVSRKGKYGLINTRGEEITPLKYDDIGQFYGDLAPVMIGGRMGYLNAAGKEIVPVQFDPNYANSGLIHAGDGVELILAKLKGRHGIMDASGQIKIPFVYDDFSSEPYVGFVYFIKLGVLWARRGGKYALVDRNGKEIIPPKYDAVLVNDRSFYEKGFPVQVGRHWGLVNKEGREVVPARYDWVDDHFCNGFIRVSLNGGRGLLDAEGRVVVPTEYEDSWPLGESLFMVKRVGKYGVVNRTGAFVVPLKYDSLSGFLQGVAIASGGGKWGLIDRSGREVLPLRYDRVELANRLPEEAGRGQLRYKVLIGNKFGYVNQDGAEITPLVYEDFGNRSLMAGKSDKSWRFSEGVACVKRGDKYGLINLEGREVIPPKYDRPFYFLNGQPGLTLVYLNGRSGYINKNGVEYFED